MDLLSHGHHNDGAKHREVWNLLLNRPYSDGGGEFSGRVAKEGESRVVDEEGLKQPWVKASNAIYNEVTVPSKQHIYSWGKLR